MRALKLRVARTQTEGVELDVRERLLASRAQSRVHHLPGACKGRHGQGGARGHALVQRDAARPVVDPEDIEGARRGVGYKEPLDA